MNFLPCRLVENGSGELSVRLSDKLSFPVPPDRASRATHPMSATS